MNKNHSYEVSIKWTGNKGVGTLNYRDFERSHSISSGRKIEILCSSDPAF